LVSSGIGEHGVSKEGAGIGKSPAFNLIVSLNVIFYLLKKA
jgi:hypothetical protein